MHAVIRPFDVAALREQYRKAQPFPFFNIDNFLQPEFVSEVVASYPTYEQAMAIGKQFSAVNERLKIQVTDSAKFPPAVQRLNEALSSPEFLAAVEQITGIRALLADETLEGGGMHLTGSGGRLDVHVDFNLREEGQLHRRLNILIYLNPVWESEWGGKIELWDKDVKNCVQAFEPVLNRCVVFETTDSSFHGVSPNKCPPGFVRKSFAAYYYTQEAPEGWDGKTHSTVFRARPDELIRGNLLMPMERAGRGISSGIRRTKAFVRQLIGR